MKTRIMTAAPIMQWENESFSAITTACPLVYIQAQQVLLDQR